MCSAFVPGSHTTQPPARYTEASLVKAMEELGVGRPSTYASVISTILDRGYVWKKGPALVPSWTAFAVVGLLERYFANLVDYGFTATMEDDLDEIAAGTEEALPWLTRFYFGSDAPGLLGGLGEALLAQPIDCACEIAIGFDERRLAVHHAGVGLVAEFLDHGSGDVGHVAILFMSSVAFRSGRLNNCTSMA